MILDTTPFVAKHNNKIKIKSNSTNTIVIKKSNLEGNTFNLIMLNNKYIVAAIITIEKITPNTFPTLFCFLFFFITIISSRLLILLQIKSFYKKWNSIMLIPLYLILCLLHLHRFDLIVVKPS